MTFQKTIFGEEVYCPTDTQQVERLLEKYPAYVNKPGDFLFCALRERYNWISALPEEKQIDLRCYLRDCPSINRRRQEYAEKIPK